MSEHTVLYWNRATSELYTVLREETPPALRLLLLESDDPAEARAKLGQAEFILVADWAITAGRAWTCSALSPCRRATRSPRSTTSS